MGRPSFRSTQGKTKRLTSYPLMTKDVRRTVRRLEDAGLPVPGRRRSRSGQSGLPTCSPGRAPRGRAAPRWARRPADHATSRTDATARRRGILLQRISLKGGGKAAICGRGEYSELDGVRPMAQVEIDRNLLFGILVLSDRPDRTSRSTRCLSAMDSEGKLVSSLFWERGTNRRQLSSPRQFPPIGKPFSSCVAGRAGCPPTAASTSLSGLMAGE